MHRETRGTPMGVEELSAIIKTLLQIPEESIALVSWSVFSAVIVVSHSLIDCSNISSDPFKSHSINYAALCIIATSTYIII